MQSVFLMGTKHMWQSCLICFLTESQKPVVISVQSTTTACRKTIDLSNPLLKGKSLQHDILEQCKTLFTTTIAEYMNLDNLYVMLKV